MNQISTGCNYLKIPGTVRKKIYNNDDALNIHLKVNYCGATAGTDLADKVGHVESGHDEDGQPLSEGGVPDLRLQAGEEAQGDAVGDGDGQHVGPDDPGDHVAVQDHVCREERQGEFFN